MSLQDIATNMLLLLAKMRESSTSRGEVDGTTLAKITSLPPHDINDAVALLERSGYVEWMQHLDTAPYNFSLVWITPIGRYEAERVSSFEPLTIGAESRKVESRTQVGVSLPPAPVGSPYGFNDEDWEFIAQRKARSDQLTVVMGYQFSSLHYESNVLKENVFRMLQAAVDKYNALPGSLGATLDFRPLAAGYGEHLFNEIARDIISADIAVFDTSDLNPNVMVELGVALTWGIRVLPIKFHTQPKPPSDISGQTWADYQDNAAHFLDPEHEDKLVRMVERAMRKKGRSQ